MTRNERIASTAAFVLIAAAALAIGYRWGHGGPTAPAATAASAPDTTQAKVLYWYDPMVPDQHFDKPGKSPYMDMQLVPKYADGAVPGGGIRIDPQVRQNLGVRTVAVGRGRLSAIVRVPGTVGWNLREERLISLPVDAVVEHLIVRTPYEPVRAGQVLLTVRSPTWSAALAEAQALRSAQSGEARALRGAAYERLRALGLPAGAQSDGHGGIALTAPVSGTVSEIAVREGQAAPAGSPLVRLNGTRSVWVEAALPTALTAGIAQGSAVQVFTDADASTPITGRLDALLPQVDATTRTQRARIELDNADGRLSPGQFVQVALEPTATDAILVPSESIIADGTQTRVIVLRDERFVPVAVRTGRSAGGKTEVLSGLLPGERVVASGQFLIDSEANLTGALDRLGKAVPNPAAPSGHSP
jgi:Cu(I)/Ag(I) efflux system membrane fusion protein